MIRTSIIAFFLTQPMVYASSFFVSTNGSDGNSGTQGSPFYSLEQAQVSARQNPGSTVFLRAGTFYRTNGFLLDSRDSNTVYKAYTNEVAVLSGSRQIATFASATNPALSRLPQASRGNVLVADISGLGISDYESLTNRGAITGQNINSYVRPWMPELFFNDQRQKLSRWPNQDQSQEVWAYTTSATAFNKWFTYRESHPATWSLAEPVYVHGMWHDWWEDTFFQIVSVGASTNTILTDRAPRYGFGNTQPYEALNVLEELDQPGEWVIDPTNQLVYFWPPSTGANQNTTISVLTNTMISLSNASGITIQGLMFDGARGSGVSVINSTNTMIAGCGFENLGNAAVLIGNAIWTNGEGSLDLTHDYQGGLSNSVVGCFIHDTGEGGIVMSGGDRTTLTPCYNSAINNLITNYNTNVRCYRPAVFISGVGCICSQNTIHDSPHEAIYVEGNDHVIDHCNVYRVCKDTADAGAIYSYCYDWRQQGTTIRYNLLNPSPWNGIYLDGFTSGVSMYGNAIMDATYPIFVNGGRGCLSFNNLVIGFNGSVGWQGSNPGVTGASNTVISMKEALKTVAYTSPPYSKYSTMSQLNTDITTFDGDPSATNFYQLGTAKQNTIDTNVFIAAKLNVYNIDTNTIEQISNWWPYAFTVFTNFASSNNTLYCVANRLFQMDPSLGPTQSGFAQLPAQWGVTNDAYGLVIPSLDSPYPWNLNRGPFKSLVIPSIIQVEDFDNGPQNTSYSSTANSATYNATRSWYGNNSWTSGRYRLESPFYIWGVVVNGVRTYAMDFLDAGDWAEYTVNVQYAGVYTLSLSSGWGYQNGTLHFNLDGSTLTGSLASNATATVTLPAGSHVLRLVNDTGANRLDSFTFNRIVNQTISTLAVKHADFY